MRLTPVSVLHKLEKLFKKYRLDLSNIPETERDNYEFGYLAGAERAYTYAFNLVQNLQKDYYTYEKDSPRRPPDYIYRDFELLRLSKTKLTDFIYDLAKCKGSICDTHFSSNGFSEEKMRYWIGLFKLRFTRESDLIKFHELGYTTKEPPKVAI